MPARATPARARLAVAIAVTAAANALPAAGAGAPDFGRGALPVMHNPSGSQLVDLDGDGRRDLVTAIGIEGATDTYGFSVMRRLADGFAPAVRTNTPLLPRTFQAVDANADGRMDVVAALGPAPDSRAVALLGDGTTRLASPVNLALPEVEAFALGRFEAGPGPGAVIADDEGLGYLPSTGTLAFADRQALAAVARTDVLAVDLDADGLDEVLTADRDGNIELYRGLTLVAATRLATMTDLHVADATGDGGLDVVITLQSSGTRILDGELREVARIAAGGGLAAAVGDLDGEGPPDVAVLRTSGINVFLDPQGSPIGVATASGAADVLVEDVTGDGHGDILAVEPAGSIVEVIEGDGDGGFPALRRRVETSDGATEAAAGDFDEDGHLDFVASEVEYGLPNLREAYTFLGDGTGAFTRDQELLIDGQPSGMDVGDVNDDGHADLLVGDFQAGVSEFLGLGDGTFAPRAIVTPCRLVTDVAVADLNGDGTDDAAVLCRASFYPGFVAVLLGSPAGLIPAPQVLPATAAGDAQVVDVGDLNGDGNLDIVAGYPFAGTLVYYLGQDSGLFGSFRQVDLGADLGDVDVGDVNGDGLDDVVASVPEDDLLWVVPGRADGLGEAAPIATYEYPLTMEVGALDGQGGDDILVAGGPNALTIHLGGTQGPGSPRAFAAQAPIRGDLVLGDTNEDGLTDVVAAHLGSAEVFVSRA